MRGRPTGARGYKSFSTYHPDDEPIAGSTTVAYEAARNGSLNLLRALHRYFEKREAA